MSPNLQLTDAQHETLYDHVDESAYSLDDWMNALTAFDDWLGERNIVERPVDAMLGYVHCCTLTSATTPQLTRPRHAVAGHAQRARL